MRVGIFTGDADEWNRSVARMPESSFCHLYGWRQVMQSLGHECLYADARDEAGTLRGLLPLVRVRSLLFGDYAVSMPFLSYGGPIGEPDAQRALARWADRYAADVGIDLLELRSRQPVDCDLRRNDRKITVLLPLPGDVDELDNALVSSRRRQVRRARSEGVDVRFGHDRLIDFYAVFAQNMRNLGTPVLPIRFFELVRNAFPNLVHFGVAYCDNQAVAAGCGFAWRDEMELTWVGSSQEHRNRYPNILLYRDFMARAIELGASSFNFGRSTPGGSTHKFKHQWGGREEVLPWLQSSRAGIESTPTPDRGAYRMGTRVWQRLPISWTIRLGPLLSRNIP